MCTKLTSKTKTIFRCLLKTSQQEVLPSSLLKYKKHRLDQSLSWCCTNKTILLAYDLITLQKP